MKLSLLRRRMKELAKRFPPDRLEKMAIPSYLHRNPLIPWLVNHRLKKVIQALRLEGGEDFLDFGCGSGILFYYLEDKELRYTGSDLDLGPARYLLSHRQGKITLIEATRLFKRVEDSSYQRIAAVEVLEHVDDLEKILVSLRTKLAAEGILVISGPSENRFYKFCRRIAGFQGDYHLRNIDDIVQKAEALGLKRIQSIDIPGPGPSTLFQIVSFRSDLEGR